MSSEIGKMSDREATGEAGCEICRKAALSGANDDLPQVAVYPDGPTFLRRCRACGTYWHETLRYVAPITTERAVELYPSAFDVA